LFEAPSAFAASAALVDCALAPDPAGFVVTCTVVFDGCDAGCDFLPLNGGMGGMTMLILPLLLAAVVDALVATTDGLLTSFEEVTPVPETILEVDVVTLFAVAGVGWLAAGAALSAAVAPIARACVDEASLADFSMMARCFSSSLAIIFTRSSGMGLFN
jgi:hypothetical protein